MSLQNALGLFGESVKALGRESSQPMQTLAAKYGSYEKALGQVNTVIHPRVVKRMTPAIKSALAAGYAQSGLAQSSKDGKGKLYAAAVTTARVEAGTAFEGIFISIGPGFSKDVYVRAGAWEYGATRGLGGGSSRTKKNLTKLVNQGKSVAGVKFIPPRPFFDLAGIDLDALYCATFQEELDRLMKGGGK